MKPIRLVSSGKKSALLYTSHPSSVLLFKRKRRRAVYRTAASASAYESMHKAVADIANCIKTWQPDLLFFFASGSFPLVASALHKLSVSGKVQRLKRNRVHLLPGLSWSAGSRYLGGKTPKAYGAQKVVRHINGALRGVGRRRKLKILLIDTTSRGSSSIGAILQMLDAVKGAIRIGRTGADLRLIAVFNGSRYGSYDKKRISVRDGDRVVSQFNNSKLVDLPSSINKDKWNSLWLDPAKQITLAIRPLVVESLLTEDVAALIGFGEATYFSGGNPIHETASFVVETDDGCVPLMESSGTASSTFVNMMAKPKTHRLWRRLRLLKKR